MSVQQALTVTSTDSFEDAINLIGRITNERDEARRLLIGLILQLGGSVRLESTHYNRALFDRKAIVLTTEYGVEGGAHQVLRTIKP